MIRPGLVHQHQPVGVAVERDAEIGPALAHQLGQLRRARWSRSRG